MFYRNKLIHKGDKFTTHSITKWKHSPTKHFYIVFYAVDCENTREGNFPSWFNPQEAMIVGNYAKELVKHSKPHILPRRHWDNSPYARQVLKMNNEE